MNKQLIGWGIVLSILCYGIYHSIIDIASVYKKENIQQVTQSKFDRKVLRGYDVVRFEKVQPVSNSPVYYEGVAMNCDFDCDSINFTSLALPKIGRAEFIPSYNELGGINGWMLNKQTVIVKSSQPSNADENFTGNTVKKPQY